MLRATGIACAILLADCGSSDKPGSAAGNDTFIVRDSAGITIAENVVAEPTGLPRWLVDSVPVLTIGVEAGDPAYEFDSIQGVTQLPGGVLVVLNGPRRSAYEFRFYDRTGKHIVTHGRWGEGPGESRRVNWFGGTGGDTLVALDFSAQRISWLSASAGYLRSFDYDESILRPIVGNDARAITETLIPLGDSLYAVKTFHWNPATTEPAKPATEFHILNLASRTSERLVRLNGPILIPLKLSTSTMAVTRVGETDPMLVVDRRRRRICASSGAVAEIHCLDASGRRRIIRWAYNAVPHRADEKNEYLNRTIASLTRMSRFPTADAEKVAAAIVWPESFPAFSVLQMDVVGNFWLLEMALDAAQKPSLRFRVLDPEGRLIAFATAFGVRAIGPKHWTLMFEIARAAMQWSPLEIGDTAVLRAITGADAVPKVGVFRITKTGR